jgi:hypothetical protein
MTHDPQPDIDRRLREAFEPDSRAVARVMTGASTDTAARRHWPPRLAWATVVVLAVVAGATAYWRSVPAVQPEAPQELLLLSGSFTDDVFVVSAPDGSVYLSGPGARDDRPPDGSGIVFVEGEFR